MVESNSIKFYKYNTQKLNTYKYKYEYLFFLFIDLERSLFKESISNPHGYHNMNPYSFLETIIV